MEWITDGLVAGGLLVAVVYGSAYVLVLIDEVNDELEAMNDGRGE